MFLVPLIYALIFFNNSWEFKALWSVILTALFNGIAILCTSIFSKVLSPSSSYLEIGSADRVAFVVSFNVSLAVSLYFVTRPKRSPRVGAWVFAVFALLNFLVADIIDLLFLLRSSENLSDSVLLLASAMALGISALSVFLYSAMMRYAEREYEIDARIFSVFSTGCISLDSALTVKELQMRQSGIRFERQLCALEETPIEDTELSTIVMNLLDNAIEAILRHASPPESPLIAFRIQRTREMLLIECRNPVDAATIRRRGERFLTSKSRRGHGVFHSKGHRPRGGTGGLRIRLCHHDLHDRKHPGAPARPVPRRRGPDRHLLHLSVLRRGVPRLHAPALLPDDVRRAPGRARLLAPPLPALGAGGPRRPAHPAPQQAVSAGEQEGADPALGPLLPVRQGALQARVLNEKFNRSSIFFGILKRESTGRCWRAGFARRG